MFSITKCSLPSTALLRRYVRSDTYTDCYETDVPGAISLAEYIAAFYTSPLFKLERKILEWAVARPSTDADVRNLAEGTTDTFAAWYVEDRRQEQILMCDFRDRTRSWLMVCQLSQNDNIRTRLNFGSAVVPVSKPGSGKMSLGFGYRFMLGFHKIYSRALLYSAKVRVSGRRSHNGYS